MDQYFQTQDLSVGYHGKPLIEHISINIHKGEVVTLIGPNGAGKSTILKSITKHLPKIGGAVYLDGKNLSLYSYQDLSRKMAVVLTQRVHPELMTCWDVVAAGRYPYTGRMGILKPEDKQIVIESMEKADIADLAQERFSDISDGQCQRVLLARALCQKPEIIVLDEPTSFLDIKHKIELLHVLRTMARQENMIVLMSLHEIDLAQKISDKILCVRNGEATRFGTVYEIFKQDYIQQLYQIDNGSYNPLFGSVEMIRPTGQPKVFVISSCGSGIPVYRHLQKEGIPFAAGILHENDAEYQVAQALAQEVITEKPFCPIQEKTVFKAIKILNQCKSAYIADFPIGPGNEKIKELIKAAAQKELFQLF